jgi:spore coat protein U-like protein
VNANELAKSSAFVLGAAAALALPGAAHAGTQSTNMGVSATVTANCSITVGNVAFGNVNSLGGNHDATGSVTVNCTNGAPWSVTADAGTGASATMATRRMTLGANTLNYSLFVDSGYATVWGDGTSSTAAITGTGTGAAQTRTVYGRIPAGQTGARTGGYSDVISVTVTY